MLGREEKEEEEEISETASRWQGSPSVYAACPPKAGSMLSFTNIWIQRMLEFPEIQWNTTLQNCECISGSNKKTGHLTLLFSSNTLWEKIRWRSSPYWPSSNLNSLFQFLLTLPQSPQQPWFGASFSGSPKHTANPSMFNKLVSWKKQQAAEEFRPPQVTNKAWGMWKVDHALGMRHVTAGTLSLLKVEGGVHLRPVVDFSTLLEGGAHVNKETAMPK